MPGIHIKRECNEEGVASLTSLVYMVPYNRMNIN